MVKNSDRTIQNISVIIVFYRIYSHIYCSHFAQKIQNLQQIMSKMINYSFNSEKFIINEALFDQFLYEYLR
jgi:hypothetical protein